MINWQAFRQVGVYDKLRFKKNAVILTENSDGTETSLAVAELAALNDLGATDLQKIDGITNGTAAANKALVLGASGEIATITSATITTLTAPNMAGNVTFADGTTDVDFASHDGTNGLKLGGTLVTATAAEINRACDSSAKVVTTTSTALSLTVTQHANRIVLINTDSTVANTFTLPAATGSGEKFELVNNIAQTQGTVVIAANGTDVMSGICIALDSTAAADAMCFLTSATSDKVTFNLTTTGGLGQDTVEAWDVAANTWRVKVIINGSGSLATPFSET